MEKFREEALGVEKNDGESGEELVELSLESIADINEALDQALQEIPAEALLEKQEIKNIAQKAKEAIFYYTKVVVLGGLVLGLGGDGVGSHSQETSGEKLARAKIELKTKGITSEQKTVYKPILSEVISKGVIPVGYDTEYKIKEFFPNLDKEREAWDPKREDAWHLYLGLPQKRGTFEISDYRPAHGKEDKYYYKIANFWEDYFASRAVFEPNASYDDATHQIVRRKGSPSECIKEIVDIIKKVGRYPAQDDVSLIMGGYKIDVGEDELGSYISYYDLWDLDIPLEKEGLVGKPFEIYDRMYYDPKTLEPLNLDHDKFKEEVDRNIKLKEKGEADLPG